MAIIWVPLVASACATGGESAATATASPRGSTACSDPRPQVCTMIYAPVCAEHMDGSRETLASACNACADATVTAYAMGPCEDTAQP